MTVITNNNKAMSTGDGTITDFPFGFALLQPSDVDVYIDAVLQSPGTYTVVPQAGNVPPFPTVGGTISFAVAPDNITHTPAFLAVRTVDLTQTFQPPVEGNIPENALSNAFDKAVMIDQQLAEGLTRAVQIPVTTPVGISTTLPSPVALDVLRWNVTGTALESVSPQQANLDAAANGPLPAPVAHDLLRWDATGTVLENVDPTTFPPGAGNVVGPAGATARSLPLYSDATGLLLKNGPALGNAGQFLKSRGAGADPIFADLPGAASGNYTLGRNKALTQVSGELFTVLLNDDRLLQGGLSTNCAKGSTDGVSQLGPVIWDPINPPATGATISDFAYNGCSLYVVMSDGTVYSGGANAYGQLGHGSAAATIPYLHRIEYFVSNGISIKKVFCSPGSNLATHSTVFFLSTTEKVYGAGYNLQGQLGNGNVLNQLTPVLVFDAPAVDGGGTTVVDVQTQHSTTGFSAIVTSKATGNLHVAGNGAYGTLGQGDTANHTSWVVCAVTGQVTALRLFQSNGAANMVAINDSGALFCWGSNAHHQGANGGVALKTASGTALALLTANVVDAGLIGSGTLISVWALLANGDLYTWGYNGNNCLFGANTTEITTPTKKYNQKATKVYGWQSSYVYTPVGGNLYVIDDSVRPIMRFTGATTTQNVFTSIADPSYASGSWRCNLPRQIVEGAETITDFILVAAAIGANIKGFFTTSARVLYGGGYATDAQITNYNASTIGAVQKEPTRVYNHRMNSYLQ